MTAPYAPKTPKRLERSRTNKILGGVCAGVADYLNMDATLVRVLTAILTVFTGIPIVIYIVMLLVVPEEGSQPPTGYPPVQPPASNGRSDTVWGTAGAPWEQPQNQPSNAPRDPEPVHEDRPGEPRL
jgi:phage shock protein C